VIDPDGFTFEVDDGAAFNAAMSIEVEFLDRVRLALSSRPN